MLKSVLSLALFCCCFQWTLAQNSLTLKDTIPFTLTEHNNISVACVLNGHDSIQLMFHTAVNSVSLTEEATQKLEKLQLNDSTQVKSWGGTTGSRFGTSNALQLGNLQFEDLTIWEDKHSGHHTDGKFGPNLFAGKIIEILRVVA